jgi:hypothetical protein
MILVMLAAGLGFQFLLETRGGRAVGLATITIGVAPIMVGAVMFSIGSWLYTAASWVVGLSPLSLPLYASGSLLSISELPPDFERSVPRAFLFWLLVSVLVTLWQLSNLIAARRTKARRILEEHI